MKREVVLIKCDISASYDLVSVNVIEKVTLLILWIANEDCGSCFWLKFICGMVVFKSFSANDSQMVK